MEEQNIIGIAIENLKKNYQIKANYKHTLSNKLNGSISIIINNTKIIFTVEAKQELRSHQLLKIIELAKQHDPLIIIANRLFPKIKEELRSNNIAYLETNGNVFINHKNAFLWLDVQKPLLQEKSKPNRAFSKTGLKVILQLLLNQYLINMPYRDIAKQTEVGLGNISYVFNGLKEMQFLIMLNKNEKKLNNKTQLIDKWVAVYIEKLKPSLKIGNFRFLKEEDFKNWKKIKLQNQKSCWGGEPAGDIITRFLHPEELTIYTIESRSDIIKNYKLIPDEKGNVRIYKKFWGINNVSDHVAPHLIVYADLLQKNDRRCTETAIKIYDEHIQGKI